MSCRYFDLSLRNNDKLRYFRAKQRTQFCKNAIFECVKMKFCKYFVLFIHLFNLDGRFYDIVKKILGTNFLFSLILGPEVHVQTTCTCTNE